MNILLWVLQAVLAWFCIFGGYFQTFKFEELKKVSLSLRATPPGLWAFSGRAPSWWAVGCGLILPGLTGILPVLTPVAAAANAAECAIQSSIYIYHRDRSPPFNSGTLVVLGLFIAYGRSALSPF